MEINIKTKFEESDRVFMLTMDNTYSPVEIIQLRSIEHEVNAYNVSVFKIIYEVKTIDTLHKYSVSEDRLYLLEDMVNVLNN